MAVVDTAVTGDTLEARIATAFEENIARSNGSNEWLAGVRRDAFARFRDMGFPAARDEAWKYTNIGKVLARPFNAVTGAPAAELRKAEIGRFSIADLDADIAVLVDGVFRRDLSDIQNGAISVQPLEEAMNDGGAVRHLTRYANPDTDSFLALNTSFLGSGIALRKTSAAPARPVHIINIATGGDRLVQPRILIVAEPGREMTVIETCHIVGSGDVLVNAVAEAFVGSRARLDYYRIQDAGSSYSAINNAYIYQEAESHASCTTATLSGNVIRNNVVMHPDGEHCESHLFGIFVGQDSLHIDNHTLVDHAKPNCFSNELYKGVLDDESTGVFNGRVLVRRDAQKTNAYQSNKSIILSDRATMNAKPELEIYADDVKCSHGATTGRLDAEALFYLRSRGLTRDQANTMLLLAFVRDVVENIRLDEVRATIDRLLEVRLSGRSSGA